MEIKQYKLIPELSENEILYYINNKVDIKRLPFDTVFSRAKFYIENNKVPEEYKQHFRSILRTYFKINDKVVTNIQLDKYLNKEIQFNQIKEIWEEATQYNIKELWIQTM